MNQITVPLAYNMQSPRSAVVDPHNIFSFRLPTFRLRNVRNGPPGKTADERYDRSNDREDLWSSAEQRDLRELVNVTQTNHDEKQECAPNKAVYDRNFVDVSSYDSSSVSEVSGFAPRIIKTSVSVSARGSARPD